MPNRTKLIVIVASVLLILAGCGAPPAKLGHVKMTMANLPVDVVSITATFTKGSDVRTLGLTLNSISGTADGTITGLSIGEWTIAVEAKDADNLVIYSGSGKAIVQPAKTTEATLQLTPTPGGIHIIVTFPD